jgi:hypothetical protein
MQEMMVAWTMLQGGKVLTMGFANGLDLGYGNKSVTDDTKNLKMRSK